MTTTANVILNVASGRWFPVAQDRLIASLAHVCEPSDTCIWRNSYPPGSPTHEENPYVFKIHAFRQAIRLGYSRALWLDSSCWLNFLPLSRSVT